MPYLETAVEIAREAGALLANYFERRVAFETQGRIRPGDGGRPRLARSWWSSACARTSPRTASWPKRAAATRARPNTAGSWTRWTAPPISPTAFPMFNVTLGLERAGEMIAGVVYDPIRQEMFTAERGAGAYLNNRRIHVSRRQAAGRQPGLHRLSQPQAAPQHQHPLLLPAGHGVARRAPHRVGGARPGLRGRAGGWISSGNSA